MTSRYPLADTAALMGEPTRAAMLLALLGGRALPANELARAANLSAPATSLHLAKLVQGGLLTVRSEGRHRYYRLANGDVAHAIEALGAVALPPRSTSRLDPDEPLRAARTCYDHLAGIAAVRLADRLEAAGVLRVEDDYSWSVTASGALFLAAELDLDIVKLGPGRRPLARRCLDWTERRPHLAGALGAALLQRFIERRWVTRQEGTRAVRITDRGRGGLERLGSHRAPSAQGSEEARSKVAGAQR
jgi:DNA-binding transcriptional ArsR family regulator